MRMISLAFLMLAGLACGASETKGEVCEAAARAGCTKSLQCNLTLTDRELCTSNAKKRCCEGAACDATATDLESEAKTSCVDGVGASTCDDFERMPPASCAAFAG